MRSSNYLIEFLYKLDCLISEINKLNSKINMYQKNSKIFKFDFDTKFSIAPDYFVKLRKFLHLKIDEGSYYDKKIVNFKRYFSKEINYIIAKIKQEISRIDEFQEKEMNKIVYKAIYYAKWENEIKTRDSYDVSSSIFDSFLGISKYRKLQYKNHQLKADLIKKEYNEKNFESKSIFELVNLIEDTDVKNGSILCLKEDIINAFLIDRNMIKRNSGTSWKTAQLLPKGIFEKRAHYKILNKNLINENKELEMKLKDSRLELIENKNLTKENLIRLNSKLNKILNSKMSDIAKIG